MLFSSFFTFSCESKVEEIRIDVPWGFVAGKWWGPKNVRPILALHGWQDNAGGFDRLIPLLPRHVGYLAIDLPGHGLSSRIPDGLHYTTHLNLTVMNMIYHHFKWDKISLLTHSMSGMFSYFYAGINPDRCDLLVQLDSLKPLQSSIENYIRHYEGLQDPFLHVDIKNRKRTEPPSYSYNDLAERWIKATRNSVTKETVPYLLNRGSQRSAHHPEKFFYTRDNRLKYFHFLHVPQDLALAIGQRIKAPHLTLKAGQSPYGENKLYVLEVVDALKKSNPNFEWHIVDAPHHLHLTHPTLVNEHVSNFISKHRPK